MAQKVAREKYEVFVDKNNILEIYEQRYPTAESREKIFGEMVPLIKKYNIKRVFVDITGQDLQQLNIVRKQMTNIFSNELKKFKLEKVGIVGASKFMRVIANFMFSGGGLLAPKFFDTKEEALEWLNDQTVQKNF